MCARVLGLLMSRSSAFISSLVLAPIFFITPSAAQEIISPQASPSVKMGQARISVEREVQGQNTYVLVKIIVPVSTHATSFVVSSPPRIVVDLEGTRIKKSSALPVPNNPVLKQIRIGAHPEKLRIVLDVKSDPPPPYEQSEDGQTVVIRLLEKGPGKTVPTSEPTQAHKNVTSDDPGDKATPLPTIPANPDHATPVPQVTVVAPTISATQEILETPSAPTAKPTVAASPTSPPTLEPAATKAPAPTVTATSSPTKTHTPAPTSTATATATVTATVTATSTPTTTPTVPPTNTPNPRDLGITASEGQGGLVGDVSISNSKVAAGQQNSMAQEQRILVLGYKFDYLQPGRIPIVKISLARAKVQVQMSKIDAKTYKIVVPNSRLSSAQLALPQFPPADFVGFTMVTAQEFDNRTEISVLVEPGVTLGTFVRDNEIWVKRM